MSSTGVIANILHRETIAAMVGAKTFERAERCVREGRVLRVEPSVGQIRGVVRPTDSGRPTWEARMWLHEDGIAYLCTCPIGADGKFCKHAVAIALAHMDSERHRVEARLSALRAALLAMSPAILVDALMGEGKEDPKVLMILAGIALKT